MFNNHNWLGLGALYDHLMNTKIIIVIMNKIFVWAPKTWGKWLKPWFGFGNHLVLITNDQGEPAVSYKWTGWVWGKKHPVEVQDYRKINNHFRIIYRIYLNLRKENRMSTCNRLDLQTLESPPVMPKNLPEHYWSRVSILWITG